MARTDTLTNFLTDVASAIKTKKGDQTAIQASSFDTEIANLPSGGDYAPRAIAFTNYQGNNLDYEINNLDTSNMESMERLFQGCSYVENFNLKDKNTSKITKMNYAFYDCTRAKNINLSGFDVSNCSQFIGAFRNVGKNNSEGEECTLDLSTFRINQNIGSGYMSNMFNDTKITHIDFGNNFLFSNDYYIFTNSANFDDFTLNGILKSCINTKNAKGYCLSLRNFGLSATDYPNERIEALSNYTAFINAGCSI